GVVGEVFETDRAILKKRNRLPVAFHRHHDVETLRADLPYRLLEGRVDGLDNGAREAEIAYQFDQRLEAPQIVRWVVAGELGQQQRRRLALHETVDYGAKHRNVARQFDHRAVDQLDRAGAELDDPPGQGHRTVEAREMADAEDPVRRDRL